MLFVCVLDNCHEAVGQNRDQDRYNQEMGNEQEDSHDRFAQEIVRRPLIPRLESSQHLSFGKHQYLVHGCLTFNQSPILNRNTQDPLDKPCRMKGFRNKDGRLTAGVKPSSSLSRS